MKKIVSICLLVVLVSINFSFAAGTCSPGCSTTERCVSQYGESKCVAASTTQTTNTTQTINSCTDFDNERTTQKADGTCPDKYTKESRSIGGKTFNCCNPNPVTDTKKVADPIDSPAVMGIDCDQNQLVNGQCKLNIYDTLGIRKSVRNENDPTSVGLFVQDVVLSATFFIGTLVTVALIVSGIMFIFAASSGKDPADAKKGMIGSLVGLLIVVSSYVIIRLVQYIAKGF